MPPATNLTLPARLWLLAERLVATTPPLQSLALLAARLYVAAVFFRSGLTKLHDWDITLALFMDEYHVPLLDPTIAAWLGTGAEVGLPVLLVLGLGTRFAAAGLSVLNVVAVLSLAEISDAALQGHQFWGSLLALLLLWGAGRLSLDALVVPRLRAALLGREGPKGARYTASKPPSASAPL